MDALTLVTMLVQFAIGFLVKKLNPEKAQALVPTVTFITSLIYNAGLAFAAAAKPAVVPTAVIAAGFFGTVSGVFWTVLRDTLIQTFVVTGAHSGPKNFYQGVKKLSTK